MNTRILQRCLLLKKLGRQTQQCYQVV